jgi:hypothetical protein
MDSEFIAILKKLITEQGKEVLFNSAKCKAFLADYTHGEFKKESRLLIQTIETGVPKAIDVSDNLSQCKQQQIKVLREEFFIAEEVAEDVINTLVHILNKSLEQTTLSLQNKSTSSKEINKQIPSNIEKEEEKGRFLVVWLVIIGIIIITVSFAFIAIGLINN